MVDRANRRRHANGRFAPELPLDRAALRYDYEHSPLTVQELADKHHTSISTIHRMVGHERWEPRAPHRIDPNDLIMRMFVVLDVHIRDMEKNMTKAGTTEAAVLGKLVTTLDKLIEIKDAEAKKYRSIPTESKDITDLRNKVAERIAELNRP